MERVVVIGNSGGGKSTLARKITARRGLPHIEIDSFMWQPDWTLMPGEIYESEHARLIAGERWVMDGLGWRESIATRLARATDIVLIDLPLWVHFWRAAERQIAWVAGRLEHPPAGVAEMPTEALFRDIWEVDREWMPEIRALAAAEEGRGKRVFRLTSIEELDGVVDGC